MSTLARPCFLPLLACLACVPPWDPLVGCAEANACTTSSGPTSTGDSTPTTSGGDGIQTVTGNEESTSSDTTSGVDTDDGTTGEPAAPLIVTFELTPTPIEFNGPIAVSVSADHAEGVRMELDDGEVVELTPGEPGIFDGEIAALTGLANGPHVALLTPWRDGTDGETVPAPYHIALPEPGSEGFWETGDLIGQGRVAAMGVLPTGHVVELGTLTDNGTPRCYLRRRSKGGTWGAGDVAQLVLEDACEAIDLTVDGEGAMYALVNRQGMDGVRWWVAKIAAWGEAPASVGIGTKGDTASAIAHHASGMIAVCGFAPTPLMDDDAKAWTFRPNLPGETWAFDYEDKDNKPPHWFSERTRDCVFAGDTLALVGEANGKHDNFITRDRLFTLRLELKAEMTAWTVAPAGVKTQSGGQAVAVDDQGRLVVAGYTCDDACQPEGDVRIYDAGGDLAWQVSLGTFPTKQFAAQDLRWSPAGYAVVATGGMKGNETAFTIRAFAPSKVEPLWTFARKDSQVLHLALALAIGRYGEVYAGGFGANGYPAVAYVGG